VKVFLMHPDRDFDLERDLPTNEDTIVQDLELTTLFDAMARGDKFLYGVAKTAVLSSLTDPHEIVYRQHVLADCLAHPSTVNEMYALAVEAIEGERKHWGVSRHSSPEMILHRAVQVLEGFVASVRRLRNIAEEHEAVFRSEGFSRLFAMLREELDDGYFEQIHAHLRQLRFRGGVLISAELGNANKGVRHVLRRQPEPTWWERLSRRDRSNRLSFTIPERDDNGLTALSELRGRGINLVANALAQSTDHILSFFRQLRAELGFYVGCLNLHAELTRKGEPTCLPVPLAADRGLALSARGLYEPCLSLHLTDRVVGNDLDTDGRQLVMITGANQGGKSTFLRALGLAHLMMQAGMFVAADVFRANVCTGVFTHLKREEDAAMESGKLDEELRRMSDIVDAIGPNSLLLCNESFASTNEREGSEIARQVIRAVLEAGVKVVFVTHLFDLADGFHRSGMQTALFLRAERLSDGRRTFKLPEGEPLPTSFGRDAYRQIFGRDVDAERTATSDVRRS
jgi:DNA mismatch repair ATPase MutS